MTKPFSEASAIRAISDAVFETVNFPDNLGNTAYGGCTIAAAVRSAYATVPAGYHMYSMLGHFLGPALADRTMTCSVRRVRQTRTFATRQVELSQKQDNGSSRLCLITLIDFQTQEPESFLTYSARPMGNYTPPESSPSKEENCERLLANGTVTAKQADIYKRSFNIPTKYFERREPLESLMAQNLVGIAKNVKTSQDHLPLTDKHSAFWMRSLEPFRAEIDHITALSFCLDAISHVPLSHNNMFLNDAGPFSSLDFALRVFKNGIDMNEWHLRETRTVVGAEGRTYSEGRMFDEQGRLIGSMTQQSILRPAKKESVKL